MIKYRLTTLGKIVAAIAILLGILLMIVGMTILFGDKPNTGPAAASNADINSVSITPTPTAAVTPTPSDTKQISETKEDLSTLKSLKISVFYEPDSAVLGEQYKHNLSTFTDAAKQMTDYTIVVEGNCATMFVEDTNIENLEANDSLALKRAQAVRDFLVREDIMINQIEIVSNGALKPLYDNQTKEGRKLNRRADIYFKSDDSN